MKIALPLTAANEFSTHYGAAARFIVFEVETRECTVLRRVIVDPQGSEPCGWAPLLRAAGAKLVLAGGMGHHAREQMKDHGLRVVVGVPDAAPDALIAGWLEGRLAQGENTCDRGVRAEMPHHPHGHECGCGCVG